MSPLGGILAFRRMVEFIGFSEVDGGRIPEGFFPLMMLGREPLTVASAPKPQFIHPAREVFFFLLFFSHPAVFATRFPGVF